MIPSMIRLAYFVSPHGFGHAARASAVMKAVQARRPDVHFDIFTLTPEWLFADSVGSGFTYHHVQSDVGLAQASPLRADLEETVRRLDSFLPFDQTLLTRLAVQLSDARVQLVLCDISVLGLAAARTAGLPSVLIENFTWDWIYTEYFDSAPRLRDHAEALTGLFNSATFHVQTEPFCARRPGATLRTGPVARPSRDTPAGVRRQLGLPPDARYVALTMGGVNQSYSFLDRLARHDDVWFVVPGGSEHPERRGNLILLPYRSPVYHPDLVAGSDGVIGKLGYSTLAEAYFAGSPFGFIRRPGFKESDVLARYAQTHMASLELSESVFESGEWEDFLPALLARPRRTPERRNGADEIAALVVGQLSV
jgi:hypothetical protein